MTKAVPASMQCTCTVLSLYKALFTSQIKGKGRGRRAGEGTLCMFPLSIDILVFPSQAMSWQDGYECYSPTDIDQIASSSEQDHPILVLLAHDGDNAFGGGYSYYRQCVSDFVNEAHGKVCTAGQ